MDSRENFIEVVYHLDQAILHAKQALAKAGNEAIPGWDSVLHQAAAYLQELGEAEHDSYVGSGGATVARALAQIFLEEGETFKQ